MMFVGTFPKEVVHKVGDFDVKTLRRTSPSTLGPGDDLQTCPHRWTLGLRVWDSNFHTCLEWVFRSIMTYIY